MVELTDEEHLVVSDIVESLIARYIHRFPKSEAQVQVRHVVSTHGVKYR